MPARSSRVSCCGVPSAPKASGGVRAQGATDVPTGAPLARAAPRGTPPSTETETRKYLERSEDETQCVQVHHLHGYAEASDPPSIRLGKRAQETRRRSEPSQQDGEHLRAHRKPQPRPTGHRGGVCPTRPRARGCLLPPVPVRVARKVLASAGSQGDRAGIHTEEKGEPLFPEAMHSPTESSNGSSVVQQSSGKM